MVSPLDNRTIQGLTKLLDHGDEWCAREPTYGVIFCFDKHSGYVPAAVHLKSDLNSPCLGTVGILALDGVEVFAPSYSARQPRGRAWRHIS